MPTPSPESVGASAAIAAGPCIRGCGTSLNVMGSCTNIWLYIAPIHPKVLNWGSLVLDEWLQEWKCLELAGAGSTARR